MFSYLGNANNPPDSMLLGGDALEMKKLETIKGCIALNSSYPKQKLFVTDTRISKACVEAENWTEKDIKYAVGTVEKSTHVLKALFLVYGRDYCASKSCYEKLIGKIKNATQTAEDINFEQSTNELAHINKVDPLGRTYMRVRGMWGSEHIKYDVTTSFNMVALIPIEKWNSFDNIDLIKSLDCITLQQITVCDPDNPANLNQSILVKYTIR